FGGGIESTTLLEQFLREGKTVYPVYQHWGLRWEDCELSYARHFCRALAGDRLAPLAEVRCPPGETLAGHWSRTGVGVPRAGDPAGSLEIPLRNLGLLTTAAARFAHLPELHLAMGTTADNHFSDGSRAFFDACERLFAIQFARPVRILTPL